jgi:ATP-dependent Clp protease protease subunit
MNQLKQNLISQLLMTNDFESWNCFEPKYFGADTRSVPFFTEVNQDSALLLISQLKHLEELDKEQQITILLNTPGGSLTDALAIYDVITQISCPVVVHTLGLCASAGLLILSAADYRICSPNTTFFYHQPVMDGSHINSIDSMSHLNDHYSHCKELTDDIIKNRTKIKKSLWTKNFEGKTNFYFNSDEALAFKLVDIVSQSSKLDFEIQKES